MSQISITGASTGTATFTIESPATSTNRTLTLPDETGTILTNATAGSVLQVVSTTKTDTFSRTSSVGDYGDVTGLSVSITPSSASNKILIFSNISVAAAQGQRNGFRLLRDSTVIGIANTAGSRLLAASAGSPASSSDIEQLNSAFLDSPNTTLSTTYKIQIGVEGSQLVYVNRSSTDTDNTTHYRTVSTITVMEIAA